VNPNAYAVGQRRDLGAKRARDLRGDLGRDGGRSAAAAPARIWVGRISASASASDDQQGAEDEETPGHDRSPDEGADGSPPEERRRTRGTAHRPGEMDRPRRGAVAADSTGGGGTAGGEPWDREDAVGCPSASEGGPVVQARLVAQEITVLSVRSAPR